MTTRGKVLIVPTNLPPQFLAKWRSITGRGWDYPTCKLSMVIKIEMHRSVRCMCADKSIDPPLIMPSDSDLSSARQLVVGDDWKTSSSVLPFALICVIRDE